MIAAARNRRRSFHAFLTLPPFLTLPLLGALLAACAGQGDVDRTQPDRVDKSIFFNLDGTPRTFYYRQTIVGVPPTSAYAFEGAMGDLLKVRFDIREKFLFGYRAFDYAPGSQSPTTSGSNNQDTPALIFAIYSHFDVKREYNPGTGEETNVISENITDRPWNERQFMRVDWSQNQAIAPEPAADPLANFFQAGRTSTGVAVGEGDQAFVNPNRPIISRDYIDFTFNEIRTPDYAACLQLFDVPTGDDPGGLWSCGQAELTFRNSLLPVPPQTYLPMSYPDRETLLGADNKPLRAAFDPVAQNYVDCTPTALAAAGLSGDDCFEEQVDRFSKFGFFRTVRQTYDRQVGATEEGREYLINRWNIWEDMVKRDPNGQPLLDGNKNMLPLEVSKRKTRKITYYLNPEFPADEALRKSASDVMGDWNQAMKETVAALQLAEASPKTSMKLSDVKNAAAALPDIIELKPNGCEMGSVQAFMTAHPDVVKLVKSKVSEATLDIDNLTAPDLIKACSALSAVTQNFKDDDVRKFVWQRNGDLRYSFLHWVDRPQPQGPLGYGPSSQDPETGEIISTGAYIYGASLDIYAQFAVDSVQLANGNLDPDDLLSGKTISDVLAETHSNRLARDAQQVTDATIAAAASKIRSLGRTQADRLHKIAAGIDDQALTRVRGTPLEKLLMNDDVLPGLLRGYRPGDTPPANAFDQAMTQPWFSSQAREARKQRFQTLAQKGCVYMAEFADDAILGTALKYDMLKLPPDEMFKALRADIFRGLADHEVGHTMGLRHNFAASSDALNYDDRYWPIYMSASMTTEQKESAHMSEYEYASVMDYASRFNSDINGLGKYDAAAIRFGYGEMVDLIPNATENLYTGLANDIFLSDYSKIPNEVGGIGNVNESQTTVRPYGDVINSLFSSTPLPEKPYKFCSDEFEGNIDCKTWDQGANQREIVNNITDTYRNYYVFNAYKRGRTSWSIDSYLNRIETRYFNRYQEAFQFFFFYGDAFADQDIGKDLLGASIDALNALGAVLQTPEPGEHCTTSYSPNALTIPISFDDCLLTSPKPVLNLPDAKPYFISFSDDFYYRITRSGSLYEKLDALFTLTSTESRFYRVDTFADSNRYSINFYQVFQDQVLKLLSGIIRNDPLSYTATMNGSAVAPTPVVDVTTYGILNAPTPPYALPTAVHVDTPVNKTIRYWALLLSLARLGSTWDATLDFQNFLAVAVKGADDDFTLTNVTVKEFTHPTTGVTYRAPAYAGTAPNIGSEIVDELTQITGASGVIGTMPTKFGTYSDGSALPTWYTAKAAVDAAATGTDQKAYTNALDTFNGVNQLLSYRIDLISDIRLFRKQLLLLNGVSP